MINHVPACQCSVCRPSSFGGIDVSQDDRDHLADAWEKWISSTDGEANKLRAGENGAPRSPRWVALQAIAAMRLNCMAVDR